MEIGMGVSRTSWRREQATGGYRRRPAWLVFVTLLTVAACTSNPPSAAPPTLAPTVGAPSSPLAPADPRTGVQNAVAAYMNLLHAFVTASNAGTAATTGL